MCDFKPGDEVVCVRMDQRPEMVGQTYTIESVFLCPRNHVGVTLVGEDNGSPHWAIDPRPFYGFSASAFRKVQRRDLTAWLATENTIEEPRRAPAKKRERAQ